MAERFCKVCNGWHDLNEPWPQECMGHYKRHKDGESAQVMRDIEPYKSAVSGEVIGGRRQHRDHLRARGLVEIGNENITHKAKEPPGGIPHDLIRAAQEQGHWKP